MDYIALCKEGNRLYESGDYLSAISWYDKAIAARPQYVSALYRKGEALYKLERFLESVPCFWSAYLFFQFRNEPLLMCGRALEASDSSYEACKVFSMAQVDEIDPQSLVFYISALVREGRVADAAALLPRIEADQGFNANLLRGRVLHEFGLLEEARSILAPLLPEDDAGKVADRLIGIYAGLDMFDELDALLTQAAERFKENKDQSDYYRAAKIALDIYFGKTSKDIEGYRTNTRFHLIDSAAYLAGKTHGKIPLSGSSQQTFALVQPKVPKTGVIAEFGVRNGHTINLLATLFPDRVLYGFDSFKGIPEGWNNEPAGSYTTGGRLPKVAPNVTLVDGWFDATLPGFARELTEPLALLNIDCDIYSSTKTIFDALGSHIDVGTVIIFDEYINNKTWREDEFKAFQEWVVANKVVYEYLVASFYTKQVAVQIIKKNFQ